jgi:hypothetical protein
MDPKTLSDIQTLEESLWRAETRFDDALMETVLADDFVEFGRSGRVYRRDELFMENSEFKEIDAVLPLPEFSVKYLTQDVVQAIYVSEVTYNGQVERANRSSIWCHENGTWRLRFHQGTPV